MSRPLRVVHALGWYFPESSGGTEVYVEGLIRHLQPLGVTSTVVAPESAPSTEDYEWRGVGVHRYPVADAPRRDIVEGRPHRDFAAFANWLSQREVDIYHQHTWTRGCGQAHLSYARSLGLKTVVTVHIPSVVCLRGTMMLHGAQACDGKVEVGRCTECWGQDRGIPETVRRWQSRHHTASTIASRLAPLPRLQTMLATPALVERRQRDIVRMAAEADHVVAVCQWLYDALAANGVPSEKLSLVAQGTDISSAPASTRVTHKPLRVGFIGRWDRVKGIDTLIDAFRLLDASVDAELVIHGLPADADYERELRCRAAGTPRIRIEAAVRREQIPSTLAGFDVLAVPSRWLETGPLVVLEAFATGTRVLGSALGGIAELVVSDRHGRLLPPNDPLAWSLAIADLATQRNQLTAIPSPRSVADVARETRAVYDALTH